jgi:hypothetical protein
MFHVLNVYIYILAEMSSVARDSIRNEGTREINYGSCISASTIIRCHQMQDTQISEILKCEKKYVLELRKYSN